MQNLMRVIEFYTTHWDKTYIIETPDGLLMPQDHVNFLINHLWNSKKFVIDSDKSKLLSLTDIEPRLVNLPFPNFYIDCSFDIKNFNIYGIHVREVPPHLHQFNIKDIHFEVYFCNNNDKWNGIMGFTFLRPEPMGWNFDKPRKLICDTVPKTPQPPEVMERIEKSIEAQKVCTKAIKSFMMNFILFLNEPDVYLVDVQRTEEHNQKRIKRGKIPIPPYSLVKVTGELKIYMDKLRSENAFKYSHKFWVRGHWRRFRSQKYKEKKGTKTWIKPYRKGQGILVHKDYVVK